jgi:nucleotide-binding universal stress UspA family protein
VVTGARRIVVGVGSSPSSVVALRMAGRLARRDEVPLVAVHAWAPPSGELAERRAPAPAELRLAWKRAALDQLTKSIELAWGGMPGDLSIEHVIMRGPAGQVLIQIADHAEDLLVIGAGRRSPVPWPWHGPVARYCQRHASCPVLAVPPPALPVHGRRWSSRHHVLTADPLARPAPGPGLQGT